MAGNEVSDMEAQEALAREFQPNLEGPLVGEKKLSIVIAEEYAKADPIYVAKTAALPQKYSHYRPILGDGNCGWRAAGFSYFETLLRTSRSQVEEEIARMMSLNNLLTTVGGFEAWLFEDMVEETTTLLKDIADAMETSIHTAEALILQRFNMAENSNAIVYHFRLLASSWLQANAQDYEGFIPDGGGVGTYRKEWLEPPNTEIDHLGMTLLIDVLLKPIGFAVEIVYLDRSEGTQVNSHIIQAMDAKGGPMIHLLYRPSHYDILYKDPMPLRQAIEGHANLQVNRATSFSHQHQIQQTAPMNNFQGMDDLNILSSIPGFSLAAPSHHSFASQFQSPMSSAFSPSPISNISPISAISSVSRISTIPSTCSVSPPTPVTSVHPSRSSFTSVNSPTSLTSPVLATPLAYQPTRTTLPMHSLPHSHSMLSPSGIQAQSFRPMGGSSGFAGWSDAHFSNEYF
ncbi:Peptidase C65 Otubain protein [Rutstroemia sp. NJR-2017a BBW]|nr:Peptidase C65 Otubain protein [Rutstroemia sp. NJR-2017a BBW]